MRPDQRLMRLAAEKQAHERADREHVPCYVFRRVGHPTIEDATWYVRTAAEGTPEGCGAPEYAAMPEATHAPR
jgi:hypothetical protein